MQCRSHLVAAAKGVAWIDVGAVGYVARATLGFQLEPRGMLPLYLLRHASL
jgi:hypothetical protein